LDQGKIAKLLDFNLPALRDYGNKHNVRTLALEEVIKSDQVSMSYIPKRGFAFPLPFLVTITNTNPAFANCAPFDEGQMMPFYYTKGDQDAT
jgi:hypothetical protein